MTTLMSDELWCRLFAQFVVEKIGAKEPNKFWEPQIVRRLHRSLREGLTRVEIEDRWLRKLGILKDDPTADDSKYAEHEVERRR